MAVAEGGGEVTWRGSTSFEIEVMVETNGFGNPVMRELSIDGVALTEAAARAVWMQLPASLRLALLDRAMEEAEPVGDDDWGTEDARMPEAG